MLINVSTLLREPLGSSRDYRADDELVAVPEDGYERHVSGRLRLLRSERGVLVSARLAYDVEVECARCLRRFAEPIVVEFDEEYVSLDDPHATARGREVDPDDFLVDEWRHLDLSEAVRQYEQSALPLVPLCRPDCAGLCPNCGADLNETRCGCGIGRDEDRWGALHALADELKAREESDGGS